MTDPDTVHDVPPAEQCQNKACGEDATEIVDGDALCAEHASLIDALKILRTAGLDGQS